MGYVSPPDLYSGCPSNPVFNSDFWKVEIDTVEVSYPAGGGFVKRRSDPSVGKSGCFQTILPFQIPLSNQGDFVFVFSNDLFSFSENQTERERERERERKVLFVT
ncbi:hypothetical protein RHMOL_Rhmol09G0182500 [Rhododendron molle]|uniref:Uncharacterized protein n=1 Tax=Rhododendron molle TaxID=49168 RepID=A0ACC0MGI1_RHOML|nr:hypothetical protein RHMOL_Rhmol09G0182500 [Rhododendron molle]